MTTLNIKYKVGKETFTAEVKICERTTPRSIHLFCLKDYAIKTASVVKLPYYDDDNDIYGDPDVDLQVLWMPEFKQIECLKMYKTKKEIMELF